METLHFSITINAPVKKVWDTMLNQDTYRVWTRAFSEGSYYEGSWDEGSKIRFIGPNPETGELGGMVSRIKENRPYEFVSIEHVGIMTDGKEDTESDEAKKWTPAYENYTFVEKDGATEVLVDVQVAEEEKDVFNEMWPQALKKLKELAEE